MSDWTPTHFTDADAAVLTPRPSEAASPRRDPAPAPAKPRGGDAAVPVTLTFTLPPHVTTALGDLAENMGKLAEAVAKQGEAIRTFVETFSQTQNTPKPTQSTENATGISLFDGDKPAA